MTDMTAGRSEAEELDESNMKIALLMQELEEQRARSRRVEEAISAASSHQVRGKPGIQGGAGAAPHYHENGVFAAQIPAVEHEEGGAMGGSPGIVGGSQLGFGGAARGGGRAWRHMPSVVTWFMRRPLPRGLDALYVARPALASRQQKARQATLQAREVDVVCEEVQQLREHESQVWCCAFHPEVGCFSPPNADLSPLSKPPSVCTVCACLLSQSQSPTLSSRP